MNKTQKIAVVVAVVVVGTVIWLALRAKRAAAATVADEQETSDTGNESTATLILSFPIREGDRGEAVKELQRAANRYMRTHPAILTIVLAELAVDGIWGQKTTRALSYAFAVGEMGVVSQAHYDAIISQSYS
ncbi:MAG: hypothetical protein LBD91_08475 [Prevotellaceae bacterium]|jgi:peptidoglycan hydrolase-like protein with peptidoglycan-binding domain|nr:hypothetical protein [Prevotellaceae bacterium]